MNRNSVMVNAVAAREPYIEVAVEPNISRDRLKVVLEKVLADQRIYDVLKLKGCGSCKSGLDIRIVNDYRTQIEVQI